MPPVIIAVIAYAAGYITLTTLVLSVISFVISAVLAPKPKNPQLGNFAGQARDRTISLRQPVQPRRVIYGKVRVGGTYALMHTTDDNSRMHLVIALAGHTVQGIDEIYFDDEVVPLDANGEATGKYAGFVRVKKYLGTATQVADPDLIAESGGTWASTDRGQGVAYIYVRLIGSADLFPNSIPNITAIVRGKNDIYDPRSTLVGYTTNAALCVADFLANAKYGMGAQYGSTIDNTALIASANVCDESMALVSGGSEARYTVNGSFESNATPETVVGEMLTAMAGKLVYSGGTWVIVSGYHTASVMTLTEDDARGNITVMPRLSRRDIFNAVKGVFVAPENQWQPADFPPVTNAEYQSQDNGNRIFREVNLPYTTSAPMAQRLAKIELERGRQQIVVEFPAKLGAFKLRAGSTVALTLARFGWSAKLFEVAAWKIETFEDDEGESALGVMLTLRETAADIYTWNAEETTIDLAPDTNLPDPFTVGAPSGLVAQSGTEHYLIINTVSVIRRIFISWDALPDTFVSEYEVEIKSTNSDIYSPVGTTRSTTNIYSSAVQDGGIYDIRVRARNTLGVRGAWSYVYAHRVGTSSIAQIDDTSSASASVVVDAMGNAIITFPQISDPQIFLYELRSGEIFEDGLLLATTTGNSFSLPVVSLAGLTLLIRGAYNTGGHTTITYRISFNTGTLSQASEVSWRIAEPDLVFSWLAVPGASQYVTLFEDNGVTRTRVTTTTEATFAIPKGTTSLFRVFAVGRNGNLSPYSDVSITLSGLYNYNELVNIALPITTGKYINLAFTTSSQVKRVSLLGSNPVAPYAQNINDADLYAFGYNLQNLSSASIANTPAAWFRDDFWKEKSGFFESGVLDLGGTLSGRLLLILSKNVSYAGAGPLSAYEHVRAEYMDDTYVQDVTDTQAFLTARLFVTNDSPNATDWVEVQNGDWVTEVRYVKLVVEVAMAGPLTDVTVTAAQITLDVPDITETGSLTGVTAAGKALVFSKNYNAVNTVLVTARGPIKAYVDDASISNTGCTFRADSGTLTVDYFIKGY